MTKINLVYASLKNIRENFDEFLKQLSPKRQQRILSMKNFDARVNSLGGALLLNEAAGKFNVDADSVCYAPSGKPYITDCDFYFSISHSKGYAVCSFGKVPSGCDIQVKENANLKVAERFFSQKEQDLIFESKNPEDEFFEVWCKSESYFKLTGKNECTEENTNTVHFKEYHISDKFCVIVCTFEDLSANALKIEF